MAIQISIVLFQDEPTLSGSRMIDTLASKWQNLPAATDLSEKENTLSFSLGTADVVIGTMPAPVPWSDLEGPCATSVLWRDAAAALQGHRSHAIITVRGDHSPITLSTLLTQVTVGVLSSSSESLGVYWTNASMVVPAEIFCKLAAELLPLGPPLPIWVDCRVGWIDDAKNASAGFTTGLAALGLMEIEAEPAPEPPAELHERFEGLAHYLLEHGAVIKDGDTIGGDEHEKIRVVFSRSAYGHQGLVMRLSYESNQKRSWWKRSR